MNKVQVQQNFVLKEKKLKKNNFGEREVREKFAQFEFTRDISYPKNYSRIIGPKNLHWEHQEKMFLKN